MKESAALFEARRKKIYCRTKTTCIVLSLVLLHRGEVKAREGSRVGKPSDWAKVQESWRLTFLSPALTHHHQHFLWPHHLGGGECGGAGQAGRRGSENVDFCPWVRCVWVYVLQMKNRLITFLWLWKCPWPLLKKNLLYHLGRQIWLHLFLMFKRIILATPTPKFTGSPSLSGLPTLYGLEILRHCQSEGPGDGLKRGRKNKPLRFCLRRPSCSLSCQTCWVGDSALGGGLSFFCFSDSNGTLTPDPWGAWREGDGSTWRCFLFSFLLVGARPNHFRPSESF